jgi:hypothetical protein
MKMVTTISTWLNYNSETPMKLNDTHRKKQMSKLLQQVVSSRTKRWRDLEEELDQLIKEKHPNSIGATYITDVKPEHLMGTTGINDTPGTICVILNNDEVLYDHSTDFATLIQRYRTRFSELFNIAIKPDHFLVTGKWA